MKKFTQLTPTHSSRLSFFTAAMALLLSATLINKAVARDSVGDLNAGFVQSGDFAGSFKVTGKSQLPVSIAVGGFIKAVALVDSDSERDDNYFRPSLLTAGDTEGNTQINANFTRWYLDGRAKIPADNSEVRGYLESDFISGNYRMRHAFLTWKKQQIIITAGQTWTTFQDTSAYPEMIYELGPAGGILVRQGQFRFTQSINDQINYSLAIEDPDGNRAADDVFLNAGSEEVHRMPDFAANLRWQLNEGLHLQFSTLLRELAYNNDTLNESDEAFAYAGHISGAWQLANNDKLAWSFLYGDGIGRYLIGASAFGGGDAGFVDGDGDIDTRSAMGGYVSYKHFWNERWRSNFIAGLSEQDKVNSNPYDNFESAYFLSANVFWRPNNVLNTGVEITYGKAEFYSVGQGAGFVDADTRDNSRIAFVIQLF
jgi:hypothetical protein